MTRWRVAGTIGVAAGLALAGCGSSGGGTDAATPAGDCPVDPVRVVVTVDQWSDLVEQLGGGCTEVTTIVEGGDVDPHDFEPSPADAAAFADADLVVVNGLDYDHWAEQALEGVSGDPAVIDAGEVVGLAEGDNPHIWYGPTYVSEVAAAVTDELRELLPDAAEQLDEQAATWAAEWQQVLDQVDATRTVADGATYAATESVAEYLAEALGMVDVTPEGYQRAAANETDPSPADIAAFQQVLEDGDARVLLYNVQTEGSVPEQLRSVAEGSGVAVVEVTESMPSGASGFVAWQVDQLRALASALGG